MVAGIPGLKNETWGTLRVFPTQGVQDEDLPAQIDWRHSVSSTARYGNAAKS
jgi:hypothetical protein